MKQLTIAGQPWCFEIPNSDDLFIPFCRFIVIAMVLGSCGIARADTMPLRQALHGIYERIYEPWKVEELHPEIAVSRNPKLYWHIREFMRLEVEHTFGSSASRSTEHCTEVLSQAGSFEDFICSVYVRDRQDGKGIYRFYQFIHKSGAEEICEEVVTTTSDKSSVAQSCRKVSEPIKWVFPKTLTPDFDSFSTQGALNHFRERLTDFNKSKSDDIAEYYAYLGALSEPVQLDYPEFGNGLIHDTNALVEAISMEPTLFIRPASHPNRRYIYFSNDRYEDTWTCSISLSCMAELRKVLESGSATDLAAVVSVGDKGDIARRSCRKVTDVHDGEGLDWSKVDHKNLPSWFRCQIVFRDTRYDLPHLRYEYLNQVVPHGYAASASCSKYYVHDLSAGEQSADEPVEIGHCWGPRKWVWH